jgi:hypothetical protein
MQGLLVLISAFGLLASTASAQTGAYQQATVIKVENHLTSATHVGDNPSDAPLEPDVYAHDISVRAGCNIYVGHYQSATSYLPGAFTANRQIPVRVGKHKLDFNVPGYGDLEVPIIKRRKADSACTRVERVRAL